MAKKTPSDFEKRRDEALKGFFKEPKWTAADWFKDFGITLLALIGSIIIIAIGLLGIARGFGLL
jgi:hypothetical protein